MQTKWFITVWLTYLKLLPSNEVKISLYLSSCCKETAFTDLL